MFLESNFINCEEKKETEIHGGKKKRETIKTTCNDARVLLMIIALNESAVTGHMTYD